MSYNTVGTSSSQSRLKMCAIRCAFEAIALHLSCSLNSQSNQRHRSLKNVTVDRKIEPTKSLRHSIPIAGSSRIANILCISNVHWSEANAKDLELYSKCIGNKRISSQYLNYVKYKQTHTVGLVYGHSLPNDKLIDILLYNSLWILAQNKTLYMPMLFERVRVNKCFTI